MVGDKMILKLQEYFKKLHVEVVGFALLKINLPPNYERAIVNT